MGVATASGMITPLSVEFETALATFTLPEPEEAEAIMIGSAMTNTRAPAHMPNLRMLSLILGPPGFLERTTMVRLLVRRESLIQNAFKALDAFLFQGFNSLLSIRN